MRSDNRKGKGKQQEGPELEKAVSAKKKGMGKGALIKGMTKRLPIEILDNPIFQGRLREIMRDYAGIYALYDGGKLYYVGLAKGLLGRIRHHQKDVHAGKWDSFIIFRIKRVRYLKDIETLLVNLVSTPGNKQKGKVPRDADINVLLRDVLKEEQAEIRKIENALKP